MPKDSYQVSYCDSKQTRRRPFTRRPPTRCGLLMRVIVASTRHDSDRVSPSEVAPPHLLSCQAFGGCRGFGSPCRPHQDLEEHPNPATFCQVPARRSSLQQTFSGCRDRRWICTQPCLDAGLSAQPAVRCHLLQPLSQSWALIAGASSWMRPRASPWTPALCC